MTVAVTSIDPRLLKLVGRKLYSSHPIPILVRELLQNSVDACRRRGVKPDIRITIKQLKKDASDWLVSCEDNGIGMSAEQIVNDFLRLGGKKEDWANQTGGFGIAKAAILGCDDWKVRTLDNFLDRKILHDGGEIQKRKMLEGTKITVRVQEFAWGSSITKALQMVYYSDVHVHLCVDSSIWPGYHIDDTNAGMPATEGRPLSDDLLMAVTGYLKLEFPKEVENLSETGLNVVRLNGLVQFFYGGKSDVRETNLVFDVKTDKAPDDEVYPFSMSREKLSQGMEDLVQALVSSHNANVLQSISAVAQETKAEETVTVIPGKMLRGGRDTTYARKEAAGLGLGSLVTTKLNVEEKDLSRNGHNSEEACLVVYRYRRDPEQRALHAKLLLAWQDIMQVVAATDEEFGIGITSDEYMGACRMQLDGKVFYILNPTLAIPEKMHDQLPESIVLSLWTLACHEATHRYVDDHNEWFTTTMNNIERDSAEKILVALKRIAKRLR
jgi:hypothetical protein